MTVPGGGSHHRGDRRAGVRAAGRRHPPPRADHPQGQERPARPAPAPAGPTSPPSGACRWPGAWPPPTSPTGRPTPRPSTTTASTHALWVLDEPGGRRGDRRGPSAAAPVVIADGHHRYETALTYQAERRAAARRGPGGLRPRDGARGRAVRGPAVGRAHPPHLDRRPARVDLAELFGRWFDTVHAGPARRPARRGGGASPVRSPSSPRTVCGCSRPARRPTPRRARTSTRASWPWPSTPCPTRRCAYVHDWRTAVAAVVGGRGRGGRAAAARHRGPDLGLGPRPPAHAPQEHLLLPEAPYRDGVSRGPSRPEAGLRTGLRNRPEAPARRRGTGRRGAPLRRSEMAANCAAGALFLYPPRASGHVRHAMTPSARTGIGATLGAVETSG